MPLVCLDWAFCWGSIFCWMLIGFKTEGCIICSNLDSHQMFHLAFALSSLQFLLLTGPELVVNWWNTQSTESSFSKKSNLAFKMAIDSIFKSPTKLLITLTTYDLFDTVEFLDPLFNMRSQLPLDPHFVNAVFYTTAIYLLILPILALNLVARNCQWDFFTITHTNNVTVDTSRENTPV